VDGVLKQAGVAPSEFTAAARAGVVKEGQVYGLPWDTIGRLFHVNTKLMAQAGLMQDGKPVLPTSPEELLQHARQFKQRTASRT
jgi:multiple sugar transport system substrate-binding protein